MTTKQIEEYLNMTIIADTYNKWERMGGLIETLNELIHKGGFKSELASDMGICRGDTFRCLIGQRGYAIVEQIDSGKVLYWGEEKLRHLNAF